jgi:hypothetical protein
MKYLITLFQNQIAESDLDIIKPASHSEPGQARLHKASIAKVDPAAPNSIPVHSYTGPKFGCIISENDLFPPYSDTYKIIDN